MSESKKICGIQIPVPKWYRAFAKAARVVMPIILLLVDIGTDINTAISLRRQGHLLWGFIPLLFAFLWPMCCTVLYTVSYLFFIAVSLLLFITGYCCPRVSLALKIIGLFPWAPIE